MIESRWKPTYTFLISETSYGNAASLFPKIAKYLEDIEFAIKQSDKMFEFSRLYEKIGVEKPSKTDVAESFNQACCPFAKPGHCKNRQ